MAEITVTFPALLKPFVNAREVLAAGESVAEVFATLCGRYPALEQLLFDEAGMLREHVLCFHNGENTRWFDKGLDWPVQPGDQLTIIQAVAGG